MKKTKMFTPNQLKKREMNGIIIIIIVLLILILGLTLFRVIFEVQNQYKNSEDIEKIRKMNCQNT